MPLPAKMRAVELTKPGGPEVLQVAERPLPVPKTEEILIKVAAAGVNRPDVLQRGGNYPVPPDASDLPGLEVAGEIVRGDFDPKQLDAWVARYLAPIPKPAIALPRVNLKEPERTAERRITHYAANVPLPAIALTYLTPSERSPDAEPLQVAATILAQGESSRLYRSLIYDQQIAQSADATPDLREDASVFYFNVVLASGKKPEDVERALLAEITKIQDAPVSMAELDKAKNQLVTNELRQRETSNGKALALGSSAVLLGDPNRVNTDLTKLQAVTAADVQRVMKKYFTNANRLVIYYLPESAKTNTPVTGKTSREGSGQWKQGELGEQARAGSAGKEQKGRGRAK